MHRTHKSRRWLGRLGALWVSILMALSLWPAAALADNPPAVTADLQEIHMVEGPDWDLGVMTFVLEAEAGYKLPPQEDLVITVGGEQITNFSYNAIGGDTPLTKVAVLLPTVFEDVHLTASAIEFSHDATLSSLQYQYPNAGQAFDVPGFLPTVYTYDVELPSFVAPNAFVYVDAEKSAGNLAHFSGADYDAGGVRLSNGAATCTYTVTAEDGMTTQDYVVRFTTAVPVPGDLDIVYLNGVSGNDSNDGATAEKAVKTFAKAQSLLAADGDILITNTVTVSDNQTWNLSGWGAARVVRAAGFHKALIQVKAGGKLALANLTLDGGGAMENGQPGGILGSQMIFVDEGGQLDMATGACVTGHTVSNGAPTGAPYYFAAIVNKGAMRMQPGSAVTQCLNAGMDSAAAGIDNIKGTLLLAGGTVSDCHNPYGVGGVYTTGTIQMTGGAVRNCSGHQGAGVFVGSGDFTMSGGLLTQNEQVSLNAYDRGEAGGGLYVSTGTATIKGGEISHNTASSFGGGVSVYTGSVIFSGGSIQDNTAPYGGGIFLYGHTCSLDMSGSAALQGNTANQGGGLYVYEGTVALQGEAAITGNQAPSQGSTPGVGGGVMMFGGQLNQTGGSISQNTAGSMGGGIFLQYGAIDLSDGSITGNQAGASGGGLHVYGEPANIAAYVSGAIRITNNTRTNGTADNVYLRSGRLLQVTGALSGSLGFDTAAVPTDDQDVAVATGNDLYALQGADAACFTCDAPGLRTALRQGTLYVERIPAYDIHVAPTEHGTVSTDPQTAVEGKEVALTLTPAQGYELGSLTVTQQNGDAVTVTEGKFTMPGGPVTVTAVFRPLPGDLTMQAQPQPGAPQATLPQSRAELEAAVLNDADRAALAQGQDVAITLAIKPIFPAAQEIAQMQSALDGHVIGLYLDISLFKQVGDGQPEGITRASHPLRIVLEIPEDLRAKDRAFSILRMHEGKVTVLPDLDDNPNTITIETDRFSTYALTYAQAGPVLSPTPAPGSTPTPPPTSSARTGDAGQPLGWLLLAALAIGAMLLLGRRKAEAKR